MTAMRAATKAVGATLALLALAGILAGSHARLTGFARADAMVRVAWSARPERIERCRRLTEAELAAQPAHMRTRVACVGTTARYRLEVERDGVLIDSVTVRGGGLRHDRELYVLREIAVAPGAARLSVRFVRVDSSTAFDAEAAPGGDRAARSPVEAAALNNARDSAQRAVQPPGLADRAVREDEERVRRRAEAIPPRLSLDTAATLASRSVILVTYDPLLRRLITKGAP